MCKVRVAQCVYIAQSGPESQTSIEQAPNFVLGCEAPLVPGGSGVSGVYGLSLIHISEPTRQEAISYAVFCLKKKKKNY